MKNIHYLFYISSQNICCHLEHLINLNILENAILFRSHHFRSNVTAAYHSTLNCTIARYYLTMTSQFVEWSIYFVSRDPVSSNQMTRIYTGFM